MKFKISHLTRYHYDEPVAEAYVETRLSPPHLPSQTVTRHSLLIAPETATSSYADFFGNRTEFFSLPYRHDSLTIRNKLVVETHPVRPPDPSLDCPVQEARQIYHSVLPGVFAFLELTPAVDRVRQSATWARRFFPSHEPLGKALSSLNQALHRYFAYEPGSTTVVTPLATIWRQRKGVCQDFAHVMLGILRAAGIPCRYVCGYIESQPPATSPNTESSDGPLVGVAATHAWVEALLPGMVWAAYDPTNDKECGPRHVAVSYGCDYRDAAPVRGTFKGPGEQRMEVAVKMIRLTS